MAVNPLSRHGEITTAPEPVVRQVSTVASDGARSGRIATSPAQTGETLPRRATTGPRSQAGAPTERRRQARGRARIESLLDAAEIVLSEVGLEAATTNAIAARAGTSPGTLYQFFPNKAAMADALTQRYLSRIRGDLDALAEPGIGEDGLNARVARTLEFLATYTAKHPSFKVLFAASDATLTTRTSAQTLHACVVDHLEDLIRQARPDLPADQRHRSAVIAARLVKGVLPLVEAASAEERQALLLELTLALVAYWGAARA
jgi:AcrR family transcriptional regulator